MTRILVTGGAGFIGSAVIRQLLVESDAVVINLDALTYAANLASLPGAAGHPRYVFERADILSVHLALNDETRGIVTAADLARMKPNALFVNTSRAPLIEEGALATALARGRPGYAAVDVYEDEPVTGASDPLLKLPNALCTPHLGYVERSMLEALYAMAVDGILGFASGAPVNLLNPEALTKI